MKWNLVKPFTIFIGVGARTLARSPEQYNQKTHSVSSNQWQWSSVADLIVTHLSLSFALSVVLALPICKIGRRIKYANGTQSLPNSIFLYLDKLWQIILIAFHENCAFAAIRCCRCSFNLFSLLCSFATEQFIKRISLQGKASQSVSPSNEKCSFWLIVAASIF